MVLDRPLDPAARSGLLAVMLSVAAAAPGCSQPPADPPAPPPEPRVVAVPAALATSWKMFPHRLSVLEVSFTQSDAQGGKLAAQANGGGWGAVDRPSAGLEATVWRSRQLAFEEASATIAIPPGGEHEGEPFGVSQRVSFAAGSLAGASSLVALIRGYRFSTDEYGEAARPPFESDPELPYDPAEGYTSQGIGIALGQPTLQGEQVSLDVRVRNSLGLADRADMNAAIPRATTWLRVDVVVIGAFGGATAAVSSTTSYQISAADYGKETVHLQAPDDQQRVELAGEPGMAAALFGLQAMDFWLNIEGRHDPECVVVSDKINSWGEAVSGPGRYIRQLSARLWGASYEPRTGAGVIHAELMLSNSSLYHEVGNLCLGVRARVAMLQFDDPDARPTALDPVKLELQVGVPRSVEVTW